MTNQTAEERARRWFRARGIYEKGPACDSLAGEFRAAEQAARRAALEEAVKDLLVMKVEAKDVGGILLACDWLRAQRAKGED